MEILIVGHLYVIDFENMHQYRLNDTQRRRRIKYDLTSAPKKGGGGLKLDLRRLDFVLFLFFRNLIEGFHSRKNEYNPGNLEAAPVVPSLASSVPSIIANSSPSDHPDVTRSR